LGEFFPSFLGLLDPDPDPHSEYPDGHRIWIQGGFVSQSETTGKKTEVYAGFKMVQSAFVVASSLKK
jgi:hypothetical protein